MMGKSQKTEPKLFYHGVSLERRVAAGHPLRRIGKLIDFTFVRSRVEELYGINGNVSVDPAVILKLMFLLIYEDVKSERALMEQLSLRMDWLWFCGYDLDDETPNHSVISKARRRWGQEVFDELFDRVLRQCVDAGLVDGETIHIDSSMIAANADKDRLKPNVRLIGQKAYSRLDEAAGGADECKDDDQSGFNDGDQRHVSLTDPEARLAKKNGEITLGYKDHRVIDDRCGIVTATITTPANVNDSLVLKEAVQEHRANVPADVKTVVADKGYGVIENYKYLNDIKATPCIPHQTHAKDGRFSYPDFCYDKRNDRYICPAGQLLNRIGPEQVDRKITTYRCNPTTCRKCHLRDNCMTGETAGRSLQRNTDVQYTEWADGCLSKHERRRLLGRRSQKAEGSFADAANNHGFKRARWRGLAKMRIQNLLVAAAQNIRKLLRHTSRRTTNLAVSAARAVVQTLLTLENLLTIGWNRYLSLS
jgi:IS5 family transposase